MLRCSLHLHLSLSVLLELLFEIVPQNLCLLPGQSQLLLLNPLFLSLLPCDIYELLLVGKHVFVVQFVYSTQSCVRLQSIDAALEHPTAGPLKNGTHQDADCFRAIFAVYKEHKSKVRSDEMKLEP